jgi:tRNA(Ile)-lysidine synthase
MIRSAVKIPINVAIAVSGGPDSMAALDFIRRGRKKITVLHYNHSTSFSNSAQNIVIAYCEKHNIELKLGKLLLKPNSGESLENFWRVERYKFFNIATSLPVVTCHHLDDAVENWIFTAFHGNPMMIPLKRDQFLRPFLLTTKDSLLEWCDRKDVPYIHDPSNNDISFMRNFIRHEIVSKAKFVNPGINKVIKKKIFEMQKLVD